MGTNQLFALALVLGALLGGCGSGRPSRSGPQADPAAIYIAVDCILEPEDDRTIQPPLFETKR